jgi:hypothetical protein
MTNRIEFDTGETGLRAVLKDYQEIALRTLWESKEGLGSKAVWGRVNAERAIPPGQSLDLAEGTELNHLQRLLYCASGRCLMFFL